MNPVLIAVLVLSGIGVVCALLLVLASKYMAVPVDEKFPALRGALPGANCGACGYAGCDGYASALAAGEESKANKCIAGGADVAKQLAEILGVQYEAVAEVNAFVHCRGNCSATCKKEIYEGARSCTAAKLLFGGDGACHFGCLGYGDCASVCPEQAINIINGIAHINDIRCMGCGACARACPQGIIEVLPKNIEVFVSCSSHDRGPAVKNVCSAGCIGCTLCAKKCPSEAITIVNNLPVVDNSKCTGCGTCSEVCPSKCILRGNKV
ncbi:MAG: 4Fe-4S dicluster domain-containing protein [Ruminococcaceae bacterium]|nr:4Fe-4S dicluster domain-containing protein [Oscillospiraceae bacterium]